MYIEPVILSTISLLIGAGGAMVWSYLMASKVAAPRAKRLIVEALTHEGPEVKAVRAALIEPALTAQYAAFTAQTGGEGLDIASEVINAVNATLGPLEARIGPTVSEHVLMAVNQAKAQETKALQAQLEELGVSAVVDEAKGMLAESLPPQMLQAQRILGMKVSKRYASEHPIEAQALEMGKLYLMQMLQAQGLAGEAPARAVASTEVRGFGVR
jgi:hypothetical protein